MTTPPKNNPDLASRVAALEGRLANILDRHRRREGITFACTDSHDEPRHLEPDIPVVNAAISATGKLNRAYHLAGFITQLCSEENRLEVVRLAVQALWPGMVVMPMSSVTSQAHRT